MTDTVSTNTTTMTAAVSPGEIVSPVLPEPGWKTSEFWFKLIAIGLEPIYASGIITNNTAITLVLMTLTVLGAYGYGLNRSIVKASASRAGVTVVASGPETTTTAKFTRGGL